MVVVGEVQHRRADKRRAGEVERAPRPLGNDPLCLLLSIAGCVIAQVQLEQRRSSDGATTWSGSPSMATTVVRSAS